MIKECADVGDIEIMVMESLVHFKYLCDHCKFMYVRLSQHNYMNLHAC